MFLCGKWSETSVAQSQLTQFWQIPRRRMLSCSLWTPFFFTTTPSSGTRKYAKAPSTKKTWRDSLPIDMLLSAVSVLVVAQSSSEIPEGLMNNPVLFCECLLFCSAACSQTSHFCAMLYSHACKSFFFFQLIPNIYTRCCLFACWQPQDGCTPGLVTAPSMDSEHCKGWTSLYDQIYQFYT